MTTSTDSAPNRTPGPIMSAAFGYQRGADRLSEWMGKISQYVVLVTVGVGFVNVVLRYFGRFTERNLTNNGLIETVTGSGGRRWRRASAGCSWPPT